ncbi:MAG: hypothetical protein V9E96_20625 [Chitinophagaceae bacterium]
MKGTRAMIAAAAVALVAAIAVSATSAQAARSVVHDRRGEARASWDIVRIVVANGQKTLSMKVVYRGKLKPKAYPGLGFLTGVSLDFGTSDSRYSSDFSVYNTVAEPGLHNGVLLQDKKAHTVACPGLHAQTRVKAGVVRFEVPQSCFGGQAGSVRVSGYTYAVRGAGRTHDDVNWGRWTKLG